MGLPCALVANMRYGCWKSKEKNERSEVCWLHIVSLCETSLTSVSPLWLHCWLLTACWLSRKRGLRQICFVFVRFQFHQVHTFSHLVSTITFDLRQTFQAGTFFIWRSISRKKSQLGIQIMGYEDYLSRWPKTRFQPKTAPRFAQYLLIGTTKSMHKRSNIPHPVAEFSDKKRMYGKD